MKILKPVSSTTPVSFKAPADLAKRLAAVQAAARERGLAFDVDTPLSKALVRLVRQAEADLSCGQESTPTAPAGALAASENSESESQS